MSQQNDLLAQFQNSMKSMQNQMQSTYQTLEKMPIKGESGGVTITLSCTYKFIDIDIQPRAMKGGLKDFVYHIRQAWTTACESIQKTTQGKTLELLETVDIPESIRKMGEEAEKQEDNEDEGGSGENSDGESAHKEESEDDGDGDSGSGKLSGSAAPAA